MVRRVYDAIAWRWHVGVRKRYLRRCFINGEQLAQSYLDGSPVDVARLPRGVEVRHPERSKGFAKLILEVWHDAVYTREFYDPAPGDVVIDAGANVGLFALQVAHLEPGSTVHAFEPFRVNYDLLVRNLESWGAANVKAHQVAVSGESGAGEMRSIGERSQDHRLTTDGGRSPADGEDTVRTLCLRDIVELAGGRIAMFKCDIEGSESDLFQHAEADDLAALDRCAIEWHDNIRPGTSRLIAEKLDATHEIRVEPDAKNEDWGMMYATRKKPSPRRVPASASRRIYRFDPSS